MLYKHVAEGQGLWMRRCNVRCMWALHRCCAGAVQLLVWHATENMGVGFMLCVEMLP